MCTAGTTVIRADTGDEISIGALAASGGDEHPSLGARRFASICAAHVDACFLQWPQGGFPSFGSRQGRPWKHPRTIRCSHMRDGGRLTILGRWTGRCGAARSDADVHSRPGLRPRSSCWRISSAMGRSSVISRFGMHPSTKRISKPCLGGRQALRYYGNPGRLCRCTSDDDAASGALPPHARADETPSLSGSTGLDYLAAVRTRSSFHRGSSRYRSIRSRCSYGTCGRRMVLSRSTGQIPAVASITASTSRELLDNVSRLLLRFGISTRLRTATAKEHLSTAVHARHLRSRRAIPLSAGNWLPWRREAAELAQSSV